MRNPTHPGNGKQIADPAVDRAARVMAREKIEFRNPLVDKSKIIAPDVSQHGAPRSIEKMRSTEESSFPKKRFDHDGRYADQVPDGDGQATKLRRQKSFLCNYLRLAGSLVGFLMGGSAGAALGSVVGELAGDAAEGQTNIIWSKLKLIGLWRTRGTPSDHRPSSADADRSRRDN